MPVRPATDKDIEALVELGQRAHAESPRYRDVKFNRKRALEFVEQLVFNEWALVLVAEDDGEIVGSLAGFVTPHYFSAQLYASDVFFFVDQAHRGGTIGTRLLREWDRVLTTDGRVAESVLGISSEIGDMKRTRKLYKRLGYTTRGYLMVKQHVKSNR